MMIETSKGVLKPVGELKAFFEQGVDLPGLAVERIAGLLKGGHDTVVVGEIGEQLDGGAQGSDFILDGEVGNAGLAMDLGSAELFRGDIFAEDRLDDARPGQAEEGVVRLNDESSPGGADSCRRRH